MLFLLCIVGGFFVTWISLKPMDLGEEKKRPFKVMLKSAGVIFGMSTFNFGFYGGIIKYFLQE